MMHRPPSSTEQRRVLLRIASELFDRSSRVHCFLDALDPATTSEHAQLVKTIRIALDKIEQVVEESLAVTAALSRERHALAVLSQHLSKFARWFITIHEFLVYLPRQPAKPETISMLEGAFAGQYSLHRPSTILGSVFNAVEFDFVEVLQTRLPDLTEIVIKSDANIVLQLPVCDREAPAAWAVLAHELGHAIDLERRISKEVVARFVTDESAEVYQLLLAWAQEFSADIIAAEALGWAPILALLSLEYCLFPLTNIHSPSASHPSTLWRLRVVGEHLGDKCALLAPLADEIELYNLASRYNLALSEQDSTKRLQIAAQNERVYADLIVPVTTELRAVVQALGLSLPRMTQESLDRCVHRLDQGVPISAQGQSRDILRSKIHDYRQRSFLTQQDRADTFKTLLRGFAESPLPVSSIVLAAHCSRLRKIGGFIEGDGQDARGLVTGLRRLDDLVASSIETSLVHGRLKVPGV